MLLDNKSILITGGTGSFGKVCVGQLQSQEDHHLFP